MSFQTVQGLRSFATKWDTTHNGIDELCSWVEAHASGATMGTPPNFLDGSSGSNVSSGSSTANLASVTQDDLQAMLHARLQAARGK